MIVVRTREMKQAWKTLVRSEVVSERSSLMEVLADFGFEMEKPGRDAVMHDNDNTAQDQASTRLQQLLSEKEAAIGRSLMSKQDGYVCEQVFSINHLTFRSSDFTL